MQPRMLMIDEMGYLPTGSVAANPFFQLIVHLSFFFLSLAVYTVSCPSATTIRPFLITVSTWLMPK